MKKFIAAALFLFAFVCTQAQPPKGPAKVGSQYGAGTTADGAINIAELPAQLEKQDSMETKVIAKVLDVCPKKGCWMTLQVNDSTTAFVKMKDYGFFVPLDMIGKTVVLEGEAKLKLISVKELQHYAEDAKKSQAEIDAITEPKKEIRLLASGIRVVK